MAIRLAGDDRESPCAKPAREAAQRRVARLAGLGACLWRRPRRIVCGCAPASAVTMPVCGAVPDLAGKRRAGYIMNSQLTLDRAGASPPMRAILDVVLIILNMYTWVIIASAIFSWLFAFNVINSSNQFVATVAQLLYNLTEPLLRPIRQRLPSMGGLDISPIVLLLGIFLLQRIIVYYLYPNVF
jgi:YggT family protein